MTHRAPTARACTRQRIVDNLVSNRMHKLEALSEGFEYKDLAGRDHVRG
jgi:hypothetical protein